MPLITTKDHIIDSKKIPEDVTLKYYKYSYLVARNKHTYQFISPNESKTYITFDEVYRETKYINKNGKEITLPPDYTPKILNKQTNYTIKKVNRTYSIYGVSNQKEF